MIVKIPFLPLTKFNWHPKEKTLTQDLSMLDGKVSEGDKNIWIKNFQSGKMILFELLNVEKNQGQIFAWNYRSKYSNIKLTIYND